MTRLPPTYCLREVSKPRVWRLEEDTLFLLVMRCEEDAELALWIYIFNLLFTSEYTFVDPRYLDDRIGVDEEPTKLAP